METKSATVFRTDKPARYAQAQPKPPQTLNAETQPKAPEAKALRDIVCGSAAGSLGKLVVEHPFDTVKVNLQTQPDHGPPKYNGAFDCFRKMLQQGGIPRLYRGVTIPVAGAAAENACLFWSYELAQDWIHACFFPSLTSNDHLPMLALAGAGAISGATTSFALTPIELVKCRIQAPRGSSLGLMEVVKEIYKSGGVLGFWRGHFGTFIRETGGGVAFFGGYEALSHIFRQQLPDPEKDKLSFWQRAVSGAIAGMSYNFLLFPADTIKSKIQTGELTNVRPTFTSVGLQIAKKQGLKGFYPGCGITVIRSAPASAIIFSFYEWSKGLWDKHYE